MKTKVLRQRWLVLTVAVCATTGLAVAALGDKPTAASGKTAAGAPPVLQLATGDVAQAAQGTIVRRVDITGTLAAVNQTTVTAPVEAVVADVRVRPGMSVNKGDVLLNFSTTDLQLRVNQQQAQVDAAKAQLQLARTTHDQQKALLEQQFISRNAFQNAESALASAESQVRATQAQLALANRQVQDAAVRAPFAARVAERRVEPGQRVGPNTPLLSLVDTRELELQADVAGADIGLIRVEQPVELFVEGHDDKAITGTVVRIAPVASTSNRRVPVFIRVSNPKGDIPVGLFARGQITVNTSPNVLGIPASAVRKATDGSEWVWKIAGGRLRKQPVVLGGKDTASQMVAVQRGVAAGDQVIVVPGDDFQDGQPVRIVLPAATRR